MSAPLFAWLMVHASLGTKRAAVASRRTSDCTFCDAHASNRGAFDIVWEDAEFVAFRDHSPASAHHIQLIPKAHISSVRKLTSEHVDMVRRMESIGHDILDGLRVPPTQRKMGFHIPPFTSVQHLHLHVQALPHTSVRKLKYPIAKGFGTFEKGLSWFVEVGQTIRLLDKGSPIRIAPC